MTERDERANLPEAEKRGVLPKDEEAALATPAGQFYEKTRHLFPVLHMPARPRKEPSHD